MISSCFGKKLKITIEGGSHELYVGVTIEGLPAGIHVDLDRLEGFLKRRAPGNSPYATPRKEADLPVFKSGFLPCSEPDRSLISDGNPITAIIENTNTRSADYAAHRDVPRPGHADYPAYVKYGDSVNMAGGGPFSARLTAPLCIAGGIALQLLAQKGIFLGAHIASVGPVKDLAFDALGVSTEVFQQLAASDFPVVNPQAALPMQQIIRAAAEEGDSVGGVVEACVMGLPTGIGGPMYDGLESLLSPILFGIPAVKGVEFGEGFGAGLLLGSENNDAFYVDEHKRIKTRTNHHGGILGGITTGMPLICRVGFKPTPSISRPQESVSLSGTCSAPISVKGRHDPCVVLRAVPVVEAALAIGILDAIVLHLPEVLS